MPAGIQILNTAGSVIIDENYSNFTLRQKGTANIWVPSTGGISYGTNGMVTIAVSAEAPLLALYSQNYTAMKSCSKSGGTWTFDFYVGANSGTVDFYLFDKANYANDEGCGLQVFDASFNKVFDSAKGSASIRDVFSHSSLGPSGADFSFRNNYTEGRKYAVVHSLPASGVVPIGHVQMFTVLQRVYSAAKSDFGFVDFARMIAYQGNIVDTEEQILASGPHISADYKCLVLDVTNL